MSKYVIVRLDFDVPTEAYYADNLIMAEEIRNEQIAGTGKDWRVFENAEPFIKNRFWRWLTNYVERIAD